MDEIPLPFEIERITVLPGGEDELGNTVDLEVPESLACAWWVPTSEEKIAAGHPVTETRLFAIVHGVYGWKPGDRVRIPSFDPAARLEVDGKPLDYRHGPWASEWEFGQVQITLKEVSG